MVAEGYKETEIGVIPEDWKISKLNDILTIGSGKDYKHLEKGDIPVYGTGGFMLSVNKSLYAGESVCIGRKGTIDKPMFLTGEFWTVDTLFYTHLFKGVKPKFLYYSFLQIDWKKYNEASGVPSLSKKTIEVIKIPLPPLKEQERIADILSTADEKIDAIALQITKIEELKKGLLQKLLSEGIGHSKFKDSELGKIPESWEVVKIGDIVSVAVGRDLKENNFSKQQNTEYKYPVFSNTVDNNGLYGFYNFEEYSGESLTVVGRGIGVGTAFTKNGSYGAIGRLIVLFPHKNLFPHYLTEYINYRINIFSESSGIPQLTGQAIIKYKCVLPPLQEQKQIANILSTADEKLEVLRAKKQKYETLKIGLLQKLLSGKVRV